MGLVFEFFYELCMQILTNIGVFFRTIFGAFWEAIVSSEVYINTVQHYFALFDTVGMVLGGLVLAVIAGIFGLLIFFISKMLKKFIRFRKKIVEEEEYLKEITRLNHEVAVLIDEKNKLMAMKVSQLGLKPGEEPDEETEEDGDAVDPEQGESRFVKLIDVDKKYAEEPASITYPQNYTLSELVDKFRNFAGSRMGLYYERETVMAFVSGLAASRLIILEGISGTGKTSLPYSWGKFINHDSFICPVQPSWRDRSELIGYLNEFTKRFNESDFLKGVYDFNYRNDMGLMVLDEMNLARVEYYFAEVLSILEMPDPSEWKIDVVPDTWPGDPILLKEGKCQLPTNLWFVGTANNDDSTFTITDKVYDRATPIQLNTKATAFECEDSGPIQVESDYLLRLFRDAKEQNQVSQGLLDKLEELDYYMVSNFRLAFGNRIMKQIKDFIPVYVACGGTEIAGLDYMLTYKILKKVENLNIALIRDNLRGLTAHFEKVFGEGSMPHAKAYIERIINIS